MFCIGCYLFVSDILGTVGCFYPGYLRVCLIAMDFVQEEQISECTLAGTLLANPLRTLPFVSCKHLPSATSVILKLHSFHVLSQQAQTVAGLCHRSEGTPGGCTWQQLCLPCWSPSCSSWISRSPLSSSTVKNTSSRSVEHLIQPSEHCSGAGAHGSVLLQKGCGYHLDLLVVAVMLGVCSVMGLPWFVAATVLSISHVNSLKVESECSAPGEQPKFLGIREQRVTGLMIFVLMGLSVFMTSILKVRLVYSAEFF